MSSEGPNWFSQFREASPQLSGSITVLVSWSAGGTGVTLVVLTRCGTNTLLALPHLVGRDWDTAFQVRDVWLSSAILKSARESFFFSQCLSDVFGNMKITKENTCSGLFEVKT